MYHIQLQQKWVEALSVCVCVCVCVYVYVCVCPHLMPCCVDNFVGREGESFVAQVGVQHLLKHLSTAHKEKIQKCH